MLRVPHSCIMTSWWQDVGGHWWMTQRAQPSRTVLKRWREDAGLVWDSDARPKRPRVDASTLDQSCGSAVREVEGSESEVQTSDVRRLVLQMEHLLNTIHILAVRTDDISGKVSFLASEYHELEHSQKQWQTVLDGHLESQSVRLQAMSEDLGRISERTRRLLRPS